MHDLIVSVVVRTVLRTSIGAVPAIAAALAIATSGCSSNSTSSQPTGTPATSAPATGAGSGGATAGGAKSCVYTRTGAGSATGSAPLPPAKANPSVSYTATMHTSQGAIVFTLLSSKAPCTVNSFVHLAGIGFWNSTQCHRISDADGLYMLQCGDPTAKANQAISCESTVGSGGPGYSFDDENLTHASYGAGTVAMANAGPNTNGSQFFLVYKNSLTLPASYTPFGTIVSGLNIIQKVAKAGSDNSNGTGDGHPKEKVEIESVTIKKS